MNQSQQSGGPTILSEEIEKVEKTTSKLREFLDFIKTLFIILIVAIIIRATIVEAFKIPSASMVPTLQIGDHIFVWKLSYGLRIPFVQKMIYRFDQPERGDVVVFTRPDDPATKENEPDTNIIKRVIGLPGETVEVKGTTVYINNKPIVEPYARWKEGGLIEGEFGPQVVPAGKIFLMGDNRDYSKDSRFWNDHYLPLENIKGRAFLIYWSWDSLYRMGTIIR